MRFVFICAEKATWPVTVMCTVLKVSTSGYYAWRKRPESAHDREDVRLGVLIEEAHVRSRATYGSPRVHAVLRANGLRVSRKRVIRLMKGLGLRGRKPRAFVRTTESVPGAEAAPDLIGRDFTAVAPNLKWVGDVTYLRTPEGWVYLAVLLDLYSRRVVGWAVSATNDRKLALSALQAALVSRQPSPGWIHHTDRGSPYLSEDYQKALEGAQARPSNSRRGNCHDNAAMESWNATLKRELGEVFDSLGHTERSVFQYIETFYNTTRLHSSNGNRSPDEYERAGIA